MVHADGRPLTVESSRTHRARLLVKFVGIDDRTTAEALRGGLFVASDALRGLDPSEYWHHDLVGCRVLDRGGLELGVVTNVSAGVAQDLLVVATPRGERLVPMVGEIVRAVDIEAKNIVVDPPEGLLE